MSRETVMNDNETEWAQTGDPDYKEGAKPVRLFKADLDSAVFAGVISHVQADTLWLRLSAPGLAAAREAPGRRAPKSLPDQRERRSSNFSFLNTLYYFGGMLAIGAMTLFMTLGWQSFGSWGLLVIASAYLVACLKVADNLHGRKLDVVAGLLATLAVCLVPLIVWCVQHLLGWWPPGGAERYSAYHTHIDWRWLTLEFVTLATGLVMLWRVRMPFMVMPLAVTVWYMSMDVASALMQNQRWDWAFLRDVSLVFGLATCAVAVWVDLRCRRSQVLAWRQDYAFWLYLFGAIMFWAGLSLRDSGSEWGKLGYAAINVVLVFAGAVIGRRVFTVLGAFGVAGYLGYLSHRLFKDSLMFPFVLTLLGLGVVALGIWWQRHEARFSQRLGALMPQGLRTPLAPALPVVRTDL